MLCFARLKTVKTNFYRATACAFALAVALVSLGDAPPPAHSYADGLTVAQRIGETLCEALPPKLGSQIEPQPVTLLPREQPWIEPIALTDEKKVSREVSISRGLIDLMNRVAHAKAIERLQPGFFDGYVKIISSATGDRINMPEIVEPRFWADEVIDEQASYFNQMVSILTAINLSHHYLGHYAKYADKLNAPGNGLASINQFLSPEEWEVSVKAGAANSLGCSLATDGARALFEAIDKMGHRPAWASYIVPPYADLKSLNKELGAYEVGFYRGQLDKVSSR